MLIQHLCSSNCPIVHHIKGTQVCSLPGGMQVCVLLQHQQCQSISGVAINHSRIFYHTALRLHLSFIQYPIWTAFSYQKLVQVGKAFLFIANHLSYC